MQLFSVGLFLRNMTLLTFFINFSHILVWKRTHQCESLKNYSWMIKQNQKLSFAKFKFHNFTKLDFFLVSLTSFNPYLLLKYLTASFNSWAIKKEIRSCQRHNGPKGWVLQPQSSDQISALKLWLKTSLNTSTKMLLQNLDQTSAVTGTLPSLL